MTVERVPVDLGEGAGSLSDANATRVRTAVLARLSNICYRLTQHPHTCASDP